MKEYLLDSRQHYGWIVSCSLLALLYAGDTEAMHHLGSKPDSSSSSRSTKITNLSDALKRKAEFEKELQELDELICKLKGKDVSSSSKTESESGSLDADISFPLDRKGHTPLWISAEEGNLKKMDFLLKGGADVNTKDEKGEPLLIHVINKFGEKCLETVKLLLKYKVDVNLKRKGWDTALIKAIDSSFSEKLRYELVKLLLDHGADPNIPGFRGRTPYQYADVYGYEDIRQLLMEKGASTEYDSEEELDWE